MEENIDKITEEFNNQTNLIDAGEQTGIDGDLQTQILELLDKTTENPYEYNSHVKLIELLQLQNDSEMLDLARNQMKLYFPLTEQIWFNWIEQSIQRIQDKEGLVNSLRLIEEALNDYFMISICEQKAKLLIDQYKKSLLNLEELRAMLDELIKYCELHPQSYLVFDQVLEFEEELLENNSSQENIARVKELILNRISIPNPNLSQLFEKYSPFITKYFNSEYESEMVKANNIYSKSTMIWKSLENYENTLIENQFNWQSFNSYINFVRFKLKDKPKIQILFERAIYYNPLSVQVWLDYLEYLLSEPQPNIDLIGLVAERSTKNCAWSGDLWIIRLQTNEKLGASLEDLEFIFSQAIAYGSIKLDPTELTKLFQERITYIKRQFTSLEDIPKLTELLEVCLTEYYTYAPQGDTTFKLEKLITSILTLVLDQKEKAIEIWESTVSKFKNYSQAWLSYIDFIVNYSEYEKARELFAKSSRILTDWPELIFQGWLEYESVYGDLMQAQKARHIIYTQRVKLSKNQEKALVNQAEVDAKEEQKRERLREKDRKNKAKIRAANKNKRLAETQHDNDNEDGNDSDLEFESKKAKGSHEESSKRPIILVSNLASTTTEQNLLNHFQECGAIDQINLSSSNTSAYITFKHPIALDKAETKHNSTLNSNEIKITFPHIKESNNVLYASNLPEIVEVEELKNLFNTYGTLIQIRLPSKRQGTARGFAYIHFENDEDASNALELNGSKLGQMDIHVALSNPTKKFGNRKDALKEIDYSKLFVGNIPSSVTKTTLVNLFKQYGSIKNINLLPPAKTSGSCVAFVDFLDPESGKAALAVNSYQLEGNILNVSVCDPNRKKGGSKFGGSSHSHGHNSHDKGNFNNGNKAAGSSKSVQEQSNVNNGTEEAKSSLTQFVPRARRQVAKPKSRLNI